jgi:SAM-dependent methyltransferase
METDNDETNFCVYCDKSVGRWLPYRDGKRSLVSEKLGVIGSDVVNFFCPVCECFDRERHLFLYFNALNLWPTVTSGDVLHIAPEKKLAELLKNNKNYIKGDLLPSDDSIIHLDLTNTKFPEKQFDVVIANHVLEHITEDRAALREIFRILKPGGIAVLQVPFSPLLPESLECASLQSDDIRNFLFGQEDHVRLYGMDYFDRIRKVGLEVEIISHSELLGPINSQKYGVNSCEPMILAKKTY